jgi:hypothetical protein
MDPLSQAPANPDCSPSNIFRISYGIQEGVAYDLGTGPGTPVTLSFADVEPAGA